jgi:translation initiation factor 2 subunit 3
MDSESEHDHRDEESASEVEEIEEAKPKSALKKGREILPPVERPELPYGPVRPQYSDSRLTEC